MSMLPSLYSTSERYMQLLARLEEIAPDDEDGLRQLSEEFTAVEGSLVEKGEAIAFVRAELNAHAAMCKAEAQRLIERAQHFESRVGRLEDYTIRMMRMIGRDKIEAARFTLRIQQNPAKVEVLDESLIPDEFMRQPPRPKLPPKAPDKNAIREYAEEKGITVPGVRIVRGEKLVVK